MIELVMFDADGVLFDSTESNVAYYNWIFAKVGEPPLDRDEEISAISYAASEVFAARARGDATRGFQRRGRPLAAAGCSERLAIVGSRCG